MVLTWGCGKGEKGEREGTERETHKSTTILETKRRTSEKDSTNFFNPRFPTISSQFYHKYIKAKQ